MKKYIVKKFLKKVKFDYFFRLINLSFISKIFFKRFIKRKFGDLIHLNKLSVLSNKRYLITRFLFIFFRSNFSILNFGFNINNESSNTLSTLLLSGVFSKNYLKIKGGDYCFFFNSLGLSPKILDILNKLSYENFLCEGLTSKIFKLKQYKFIILSFRFYSKILSINWLPNLNLSYNLFNSHFFYINGFYFSLVFFFIYYYLFFIVFNLNIIVFQLINVFEIINKV